MNIDPNEKRRKKLNNLKRVSPHSKEFFGIPTSAEFFYFEDAQANIVALLDNTGATVVKYKYDAWGNCKVLNASGAEITDDTHIGVLNPFRYRSYYYDAGTKLYFLKTRYYDPEIGRFMTIDDLSYLDPDSINGLNLYAYCANNPVMGIDTNGTFVITGSVLLAAALIGAAAGAIVGGFYGGITAAANNQNIFAGVLIGMLAGGIMGAGAGIAATFIAPVLAGEGILLATASGVGFVMGNSLSVGAALAIGTTVAFGSGALGGATSDILTQIVNNGSVSDVGSVGVSALQWGVLNTVGTYLSALGGPRLTNFDNFLLSQVFNHLTSSFGFLFDMFRSVFGDQKAAVATVLI